MDIFGLYTFIMYIFFTIKYEYNITLKNVLNVFVFKGHTSVGFM